jgi:RNase P subunit RPR2
MPEAHDMTREDLIDDLIFAAITYRRYVGADLNSIRARVSFHEAQKYTQADDLESLKRLETSGKIVRRGALWLLSPEAFKAAKGRAIRPEYQSEDAWILLALLHGDRSAENSLDSLISVADYINHSVPTYDEIYGALNRLQAARLIKQQTKRFTVTELAVRQYQKVKRVSRQQVLEQLAALERIMCCPCCGVQLKAVRWRIKLTEEEYANAVALYWERF